MGVRLPRGSGHLTAGKVSYIFPPFYGIYWGDTVGSNVLYPPWDQPGLKGLCDGTNAVRRKALLPHMASRGLGAGSNSVSLALATSNQLPGALMVLVAV